MIENRKYVIQFIFLFIGLIFLIKLFYIQVLDPSYKLAAENNVVRKEVEYPFRGLMYDRNNQVIVYNEPVYDLMVIPKEIRGIDTTAFCADFSITKEEFEEKIQKAKTYSYIRESPFIKQLSNAEFAKVQDLLVDYPGFYITTRTIRAYPYPMMSNAFGYIGEISRSQLEKDTLNYYKTGDYIGRSGLESQYENQLRGRRGVQYKMVNVRGVEKGSFEEGNYDTLSIPGDNLITSIDAQLQLYGEKLMKGKSGSIVAIEPSSGEILAMVSGPTYDPSLLSGRDLGKNYQVLSQDTLRPLFNRPLMAVYPPGSIWKTVQALIGMQEGVIVPSTRIRCDRSIIKCHGPHFNDNLAEAIQHSCNPYFYEVMRRIVDQNVSADPYEDPKIGLKKWREYVESFGFGKPLGIDLPNEKGGYIPGVPYYDRVYGARGWKYRTIYSLSIGQGEILAGPLQMANLGAIIANEGYYYTPHLVKSIGKDGKPLPKYHQKNFTKIQSQYFSPVKDAMESVTEWGGTGFRAGIKGIPVCGKTGTVQNPHGKDHSVFLAFAPKDNPKIAISVYVENSGWGSEAGAAIAGLMIEKYLRGADAQLRYEDFVLEEQYIR
ncbi:penicillin-binding protein 2 [Xanthovirga aplysinae]|uniref:penicillin-binding protein 2 n=1 Tax=Xanthovirga aplysinae TaxID=2529853 RepID=UPI0012BC0F28|nr:penicillin-binding protein 2 [Xanthovirga aplysinae]MTI33624.1 penicillin-binding protein 2 [Xanthovirga aplysinae]